MGDFNLPGIKWPSLSCKPGATPVEVTFLNMAIMENMSQIVTQNTRYSGGTTSSCLDLVLIRYQELVKHVVALPPIGNSDHATIFVLYNSTLRLRKNETTIPNPWKANFEAMKQVATQMCWDLSSSCDVEQAWNQICSNIFYLYHRFVPNKKVSAAIRTPPWIDAELRTILKRRNRHWKNFKLSPSGITFAIYK